MNRIQSKVDKIETSDTKNIFWSYFDGRIYIQNNGCDGLAFGYQS